MPALSEIFDKRKIFLYQNESLIVHIKLEIWF